MVEREEFQGMLGELMDELPEIFYEKLNGGILLEEECKVSPHAVSEDMFILGEYLYSSVMGRQIKIYYGSFCRMYSDMTKAELKDRLRKTLRHEFRHHLESQAGEKGLEIEDAVYIQNYINRVKKMR